MQRCMPPIELALLPAGWGGAEVHAPIVLALLPVGPAPHLVGECGDLASTTALVGHVRLQRVS